MQQEMAKTLSADYVMVALAGHSPARERPSETAAALINFFTKS
jgi:pimeloyl-ACP methyl ester carboxylesterase